MSTQKFGLNAGRRLCVRSFCSSAGVPGQVPSTPPTVPPPTVSAKVKIIGLAMFGFSLGTALMYCTDFLCFRTDFLLRKKKARLAEERKARLAEVKEFGRTGRTKLPGDEDY